MPGAERGTLPDLERIGKYDVVERIAVGGFATLYKGRDPFLKRLVAIKVCASDDPALRQQFLREAEIAGRLDHPNIVRTFDFGFEKVGPFLVQEYLEGEDLLQKIERRDPAGPRTKLTTLVQIAEGLEYSHARGVLHLDIKPGNVRIIEGRQAKILDFGIARLASPDIGSGLDGMVGTAGYLPPEQVRGGDVDARADVFAFGALAYELLAYKRPFAGATVEQILKRVFADAPAPLEQVWPQCPPGLGPLVARCLEKEPAHRYAGLSELIPELEAIRAALPKDHETDAWPEQPPAPPVDRPAVRVAADVEAGEPVQASGWSGSRVARRPSRLLLAAASLVAAVAAVGWWARAPQEVGNGGSSTSPQARSAAAASDAASPMGALFVTAVPWGEVVRITESGSGDVAFAGPSFTPLRVEVAPGLYDVVVSGPQGSGMRTCLVRVVAESTHVCHALMSEPQVMDYFKELGWWR